MKWPWRRKTIVLGSELAAARKAEELRLASGLSGPSPLPNNSYDVERGDYDLVTVSPLQIDFELRSFTNDFLELNPQQRPAVAQRLSFDDLYTLIHFVKRSAVLGLNGDSAGWCRAGLIALSMLDKTRIDPRDAWWSAGLLRHTINTVPGISNELRDEVARNGLSHVAALFTDSAQTSNLSGLGYAEHRTAIGVGLIQHGGKRYEPSFDLTTVAIQISDAMTNGRYVADVEIATELPEIWFAKDRRDDASMRLNGALATASIHATLRKAYCRGDNQRFFGWIVEMPAPSDCEQLIADVGKGSTHDGKFVIGISVDRLFVLLLAGSFQQGVKPYESLEALSTLAEQIRKLIKLSVAKGDKH